MVRIAVKKKMRAQGKHWYNNGQIEGYFFECPEGWSKGRLPIKESTRLKHIENNGMHNLREEQKQARNKKLREFNQNASEEFKKKKSENISKSRKGKGLGKIPWNKGKTGLQVAWNKGRSGYLTKTKNQAVKLYDNTSKKKEITKLC